MFQNKVEWLFIENNEADIEFCYIHVHVHVQRRKEGKGVCVCVCVCVYVCVCVSSLTISTPRGRGVFFLSSTGNLWRTDPLYELSSGESTSDRERYMSMKQRKLSLSLFLSLSFPPSLPPSLTHSLNHSLPPSFHPQSLLIPKYTCTQEVLVQINHRVKTHTIPIHKLPTMPYYMYMYIHV